MHKITLEEKETRREYYLVSALSGSIIIGEDTWKIDSGASKHMSGYKGALSNLKEKQFSCMVELGDNSTYPILGVGSTSFQLNSGDMIHMDDILYVPRLKKNLLSVSVLEDKGFHVIFMENQVYLWPKNQNLDIAVIFGVREGGLYKVLGKIISAMVHHTISPCELWHRRLEHLHFRALPGLQ